MLVFFVRSVLNFLKVQILLVILFLENLLINHNRNLLNYGENEIKTLCDFYETEKEQNNTTFNLLLDKKTLKSE